MIQTPKPEHRIVRYELTDFEWTAIAANYLAFIKLASIRIWLRANASTPRTPELHFAIASVAPRTDDQHLHLNKIADRYHCGDMFKLRLGNSIRRAEFQSSVKPFLSISTMHRR
jgi:hypothetical protein